MLRVQTVLIPGNVNKGTVFSQDNLREVRLVTKIRIKGNARRCLGTILVYSNIFDKANAV